MGNTCGCGEDRKGADAKTSIKSNPAQISQYQVPGFQSKITPASFVNIPAQEKDALLAEAFKILVTVVEPDKIVSNNPFVKQMTAKTTGKVQNAEGDEYEGELIDGVANGKGKIRSKDGSVYEGSVFNGLRHGQGKVVEAGSEPRSYTAQFYNNVPIGLVSQKINARDDGAGELEGAFDTRGQESGPYIMKYNDGEVAYFSQKSGRCEGIHVLISKDKNSLIVTDFKGGVEVKPGTIYNATAAPIPSSK